jgi:hypothetical protein
VIGMKAQDKFNRILFLSAKVNENFPELGMELAELQDMDPAKFKQAILSSDLGYRKALYLVQIANVFGLLAVDRERLIEVGWTKLQMIASYVDSDNVDQFLTLARNNTVHRLRRLLANKPIDGETRCVVLYFSPGQYKLFLQSLQAQGYNPKISDLSREEALIKLLLTVY